MCLEPFALEALGTDVFEHADQMFWFTIVAALQRGASAHPDVIAAFVTHAFFHFIAFAFAGQHAL